MLGCFSWRTSATGCPILVQTSLGRRHPPLSFGGPMYRLLQIFRHQCAVEAARQAILLLVVTSCDAAFSVPPFRQHVPHQTCLDSPLQEFQPPVYPILDLPVFACAQCLSQDNMDKDEGSLKVPYPIKYPPSLRCQYCSEPAPHFSGGCGIPAI